MVIKETVQKFEVINTTKRMMRKNSMKSSGYLLQVCINFENKTDTTICRGVQKAEPKPCLLRKPAMKSNNLFYFSLDQR